MNHEASSIEEAVGTTKEKVFEYAEKNPNVHQVVDDAINGVPEAIVFVTLGMRHCLVAFLISQDIKALKHMATMVKSYDKPTKAIEAMLEDPEKYYNTLLLAAKCTEFILKEGGV